MSRVHDALRRAEQSGVFAPGIAEPQAPSHVATAAAPAVEPPSAAKGFLDLVTTIPFTPSPDALVIDPLHPHEAPTEEFRTLRTRLNHMQSLQPIHTTVVTSPSPA